MQHFIRTRINSFRFALAGMHYILRTQPNTWIHAAISLAVIALGFWLNIPPLSWALIIVSMGMVWMAECLNTALEILIDLVSAQQHPLAKISKDVAAAGVLLAALAAVGVGLLVFGPSLIQRISSPN